MCFLPSIVTVQTSWCREVLRVFKPSIAAARAPPDLAVDVDDQQDIDLRIFQPASASVKMLSICFDPLLTLPCDVLYVFEFLVTLAEKMHHLL